jgi:allantoin racemase
VKIKVIVAFPASNDELSERTAVLQAYVGADVDIECVAVRNSGTTMDSDYESLIFNAYITEAGLQAENEGYDAVVVDTVSDAGLYAL